MKTKYLILSTLSLFVFAMLWNSLIHMVILKQANMQVVELHRPETSMGLSILLTLLLAFLFSVGYLKWNSSSSQKATIEYSFFFTLLMGVMVNMNQYILYPIPGILSLTWFAFGIIEFFIYGQISRLVYRMAERNTDK